MISGGGENKWQMKSKLEKTKRLIVHSADLNVLARKRTLAEVRKREHYEKPSVKRKKKSEAARKRKFRA
jgi:hypothetical protein